MEIDPALLMRQRALAVLQWKEVYGSGSMWDVVKRDVARLDAITLVASASHWNALAFDVEGRYSPARQDEVVRSLASSEQLESIDRAIKRRARRGGWTLEFPPPILNRQQLLILIRLALQYGSREQPGRNVGRHDILDLLLRINDHLDAFPQPQGKARRTRQRSAYERLLAFPALFSMVDFNRRRSPEHGVARTLRMMREIHSELGERHGTDGRVLDLHGMFRESTGLPLETYLALSFMAFARTTPPGEPGSPNTGVVTAEDTGTFNIVPESLMAQDSTLTRDDVESFLNTVSRTPEEFQKALAGSSALPEQTNFTSFRKYPMIRFPSGRLRVLDRAFLLDKLGDGAYWILRDAVERNTEGQARLNRVKDLNGWWGYLFEGYVHRLFKYSGAARTYTPAPVFEGSTSTEGSTDGLLDQGDDLVVLEYKVSPVTPHGRHALRARVLAAELLSKFAGRKRARDGKGTRVGLGVPQLANAIKGLLAGKALGPVRIDRIQRIYPVLVCAEIAMDAPMVNCFLNRQLARELGKEDRSKVQPLTVVSIDLLERMLAYTDDVSFAEMLSAWHRLDPRMTTYPSLVIGEQFPRKERINQWVREGADAWKTEMLTRLWPKGETAQNLVAAEGICDDAPEHE